MLTPSDLRQPAPRLPGIYCLWLSPSVVYLVTLHSAVRLNPIGQGKVPPRVSATAVGDFNTPLSTMDRSSKQNFKKDIVELNDALDQMDLTDIYRACFIPKKQNTHSFQMHIEHFQR